jgi:transglutaminase-like putative cysteine protease
MFLRVTHHTKYEYTNLVSFAPHTVYLRPRESEKQRLHEYSLEISPEARRVSSTDVENNSIEWLYFNGQSSFLDLKSQCLVETLNTNPFDFFLEPNALNFPFNYSQLDLSILKPHLAASDGTNYSEINHWLEKHLHAPPLDSISFIRALNTAVFVSLTYVRRDEEGIQSVHETLERGSGSCRDYAVLLIAICRHLGLAARFVSGYVYEPVNIANPHQTELSMHAWVEVYLPGGGWRGLDPSRGIFCDDTFIAVAHSARAETVSPIRGKFYSAIPAEASLCTNLNIENRGVL